jgi:hypothetical protein
VAAVGNPGRIAPGVHGAAVVAAVDGMVAGDSLR